MYFVYMIECKPKPAKKKRKGKRRRNIKKVSYYTGYTNDPKRRLGEHVSGKGAQYLKNKILLRMIICHEYHTQKQAMAGELEVKAMAYSAKWLRLDNIFKDSLKELRIPVHGLANWYPFWYFDDKKQQGVFTFTDSWVAEMMEEEFIAEETRELKIREKKSTKDI